MALKGRKQVSKKELTKRYILCTAGLFLTALGVAFAKSAELGVSPISSVANVMNLKFTDISMGNWLIIWNCVMIVGQILILRKDFQLIQLLQVPLSFLFGWFTDIGMWIISFFLPERYIFKLAFVFIGVIVLGMGIAMTVTADVILNSGEGFVKAIADKTGKVFGNVKTAFDISCVILSIILSLLMFNFTIQGTREGTLIAALSTGTSVKFWNKRLRKPLEKWLVK